MRVESHRAARFPFSANIEVIDVQSERFLNARTRDLSIFGCYVSTATPFPAGKKVSLRITHAGTILTALGKVVSSNPNSGMGVFFTKIEPNGQAILEKWLSALRST